ncbi:hypothetical protein GHT06_003808 [Daphnia sinensis]|uniref:Uncharacterized protein n=1 Tax=Daphnia sinensis TaxID=1820382 RepID=A0AAD5KEU8_9CRUS|nr:hypothetical protein GHT06_003808 [Daphnia sinensis]
MNFVVLSNRNRTPVKVEAMDRRYFVVDVGNYARRHPEVIAEYIGMYTHQASPDMVENCKHVYMYLAQLPGVPEYLGDAPTTVLKERLMSGNEINEDPVLSYLRDAVSRPDYVSDDDWAQYSLQDQAEYTASALATKLGIWAAQNNVSCVTTARALARNMHILKLDSRTGHRSTKLYKVDRVALNV